MTDGFVDAILAAPLGVALLARLEAGPRGRTDYLRDETTPDGVACAVEAVERSPLGEFLDVVITTGTIDVGPWVGWAPHVAAAAYRHADARAPIAQAIDTRFGEALHASLDLDRQQWWTSANAGVERMAPLFERFDETDGDGQFTLAGLWTVTDPPDVTHPGLADVWEIHPHPVTRWDLPVAADARVLEIHRPGDWARLALEYPHAAGTSAAHWELPSVNQDLGEIEDLLTIPEQRAARVALRRNLVPDWRSVSEAFDGVHLSWAGFITTEGCITDLPGGDVTMLRYWFSERSHWLRDVFGQPTPAPALWQEDAEPIDVDPERRDRDLATLGRLLGRRTQESS